MNEDTRTSQVDPQPWHTHSTSVAFQNRWITVNVDAVELPTGAEYEYTRLNVNGVGVAVVGFNRERTHVLLEREYRHGVGEVVWQLPGGLADTGEERAAAGLRELREETGYAPADPQSVTLLGMVWDNPALGVSRSYIYGAVDLQRVQEPHRDPGEFVSLHWQPIDWLLSAVRDGTVHDRVLVSAVAYLLLHGWITNPSTSENREDA